MYEQWENKNYVRHQNTDVESSENNTQGGCCQKLHLDMFYTNFRGKSNEDGTLKDVKRK